MVALKKFLISLADLSSLSKKYSDQVQIFYSNYKISNKPIHFCVNSAGLRSALCKYRLYNSGFGSL